MYKGPQMVESYLKKKKKRPNLTAKTSLRYFKFDMMEHTFSFKDTQENPEIKVIHVGRDLLTFEDRLEPRDQSLCDWKYGFKLVTRVRIYVLFAETKEVFVKWVRILNMYFNKVDILNPHSVYNNFNSISSSISDDLIPEVKPKREITDIPSHMNMNSNNRNFIFNDDFMEDDLDLLNDIGGANKQENVFDMLSNNKSIKDSSNNLNKVDYDTKNSVKPSKSVNPSERSNYNSKVNPFEEDDWEPNMQVKAKKNSNSNNREEIKDDEIYKSKSGNRRFNPGVEENESELNISNSSPFKNKSNVNLNNISKVFSNLNDSGFENENKLNPAMIRKDSNNQVVKTPLRDAPNNNKKEEERKFNEKIEPIEPIEPNSIPKNIFDKGLIKDLTKNNNNNFLNLNFDLATKPPVKHIPNNDPNLNWNDLNDDWGYNKPSKTVANLLNKNANNENLVLEAKNKPKPRDQLVNLFDDPHLHIKKSSEAKKVSIENLHFSSNLPVPDHNIIDGTRPYSKSKSPMHPVPRGIRRQYDNVDPHDVKLDESRMIRLEEGEEMSVRRKIVGNEGGYKSFVMNLVVPEKLTKIEKPVDRVKQMTEKLLNPEYENPVYMGKSRSSVINTTMNTSGLLMNVSTNKLHPEPLIREPQEMIPGEFNPLNMADLIMKTGDKKAYLENLKKMESVNGDRIHEQIPHDEYHTRITKTYKVESTTYLGDDFHMPAVLVKDPPKKNQNGVSLIISGKDDNNTNKNINTIFLPNEGGFFPDEMNQSIAKDNFNNTNLNDISRISRHYSQLNIEEVWDTSIIEDDLIFQLK